MVLYIYQLIDYGIRKRLIEEEDRYYIYNQLLHFFRLKDEKPPKDIISITFPEEAIFPLLDDLFKRGLIENNSIQYKDLLLSKVMNIFAKKPSAVINTFNTLSKKRVSDATDWFYKYMQDLDYIKTERVSKNKHYFIDSKYGKIEITINVSKPEKDPKMIAEALKEKEMSYPKCVLCPENEGFAGNVSRESRDTLRLIPLTLNNETWYFQYSPYIYYNEHAIMLSKEHRPMVINKQTFSNLLELVTKIEGYFFGSNADLPIVGGSILTHDHYQGGKYEFPIERAQALKTYFYKDITIEVLDWPLSTIRLKGLNKDTIIDLSTLFLNAWIDYTNPKEHIYAHTTERHNAITPIARYKDTYEMDLVFRNNYTNEDFPFGLYHPHKDVWPIKKENIGLIEVMGLAVLPKRLLEELKALSLAFSGGEIPSGFSEYFKTIEKDYKGEDPLSYVYKKAGETFMKGLEDCKVLRDEVFIEFIEGVLLND